MIQGSNYFAFIPKGTSTKEDVFIFFDAAFKAADGKSSFGFWMKLNVIIVGAGTT